MLHFVVYADDLGPGPAGLVQLQELVLRVISLAAQFAFLCLTLMFVYAGIRFITSNGDQKNIAAARQIAIQAVTGIVFLGLAWIVLRLISSFTGTDVTHFCLGFPGAPTGCK